MPSNSPHLEFSPAAYASGLAVDAEGIWFARDRPPVSYLEGGNEMCFDLEASSFWFAHRGDCVALAVRNFPPVGPIFDVGGGNGYVSARLMREGFAAVVLEPGVAGARNAARRGVAGVICATLESAGIRPGSLPAVGLFDVLEHIGHESAFLAQLHAALKPGGRLYLTVPACNGLWSHDDVVAGHFRRYTLGRLHATLAQAGFRVNYSSYLFSILPPALWLLRSLPSLFGRRALAAQTYHKLHRPRLPGATAGVWRWERSRIAARRRIPIGTSCLVVAENIP